MIRISNFSYWELNTNDTNHPWFPFFWRYAHSLLLFGLVSKTFIITSLIYVMGSTFSAIPFAFWVRPHYQEKKPTFYLNYQYSHIFYFSKSIYFVPNMGISPTFWVFLLLYFFKIWSESTDCWTKLWIIINA